MSLLRLMLKVVGPGREYFPSATAPFLDIPSRDKGRFLKSYIYPSSKASSGPKPVLLNFHGSGFFFHLHGFDRETCSMIAEQTDYTVLDVKHRLGPEDPFPASLNDTEDAIRYVLAHPDEYDVSRIALLSHSSAGSLICAAAATRFPTGVINSIVAFYPLIDLSTDPREKIAPDTGGPTVPSWMANLYVAAYVPPNLNPRDPRISPLYADPARFPDNVLIITGGSDDLTPEGEALGKKLKEAGKKNVVVKRFPKCTHGFDMKPKNDNELAAKNEALQLSIDFLRSQ